MAAWQVPETFTFEDQTVRYGVIGDGPPLVLLHGTPFSSYEWHRIAPLMAQHRRVYFHDMLGYGHSEKRDGQDVSLGLQNRLFSALVDHWGLRQPDVVAHDFGAATALRAHLLNSREYRSLTLIDAVAIRPWGSPFVQHVRMHEAAFAAMPAYAHEALVRAYLRTAFCRQMTDEELRPYAEPWFGDIGQRAFYRQIAQMDMRYTDDVQNGFGEIRCPVQILWGENDGWIPIERGRKLAEMIPSARFIPVPDSGHLMHEDAPESIVAALLDFLPTGSGNRTMAQLNNS